MDIGRETIKVYMQSEEEKPAVEKASAKAFGHATVLHVQNFLDCVKSRKTPTATMEKAFQAALVAQLANLSLKTGRRMKWNAAKQKVEA
jgi:hypothetical protein